MNSKTGTDRIDWRRAVGAALASGALAAGVVTGLATPSAVAQPTQPTQPSVTETPTPEANGPRTPCTGDECSKPADDQPAATAAGPVTPCTGQECKNAAEAEPQKMTADQALAIIQSDYDLGDGGGQLSQLIHDVTTLRNQGYRPSNANRDAIEAALQHRPNETPLVEALKDTLAYQRKLQAQAAMAGNNGSQKQPITIGPNAGITLPFG
jgi:hypothetical protein